MSEPSTIKINETEYVRKDSQTATDGEIKIVVADRGFVYIGRVQVSDDFVTLKSAKNIRKWGTTKGLGELVAGPLSGTTLDSVGSVKIPMRAVISIIDVEQKKWNCI